MKLNNGLEVYGIIYKITNLINNKSYIGQTVKEFNRRYSSGIEKSDNYYLRKSIEKYGIENFKVNKMLDVAFSKKELDAKEWSWIKIYKCTDRNFGYNIREGGEHGKHSCETIEKLSKSLKGKNVGKDNPKSKKVVCLNTKMIFDSIHSAEKELNITGIDNCCLKTRNSAGIINGIRLVWMYYDEYINSTKEDIETVIKTAQEFIYGEKNGFYNKKHTYKTRKKMSDNHYDCSGSKNPASRKVICLNTKEVFDTIKDASLKYNAPPTTLGLCCKGKRKSSGKLKDGTPLRWMYYEDWIKADYTGNV